MKTIERSELEKFFDVILSPQQYKDYGPNGLQIEGVEHISKIAFAVSAQKKSIEKAVEMGCQCLVVHHGLFWSFHGPRTITKSFAKRIKPLVQNDINLFGYHLPLDGHIEFGNAATLAKKLGLTNLHPFGDYKGMPTGVKGVFAEPKAPEEVKEIIATAVEHSVLHSNAEDRPQIKSVGIITGGANSGWKDAYNEGLDAYLTGEMSEHDYHEARESDVHMFAAGHNATEKFGIKALMGLVEKNFEVECVFIDSSNPA
ncbi:Nif3-like dinuclear metal center hexameric protein [Bacteriovorax sp. Seq25_V]|uniref:Nif3-like dinuclear metal center hexameric protein n=1 Tax=Bacteriovorax sp. Seq25_V TaxID=1201288 RepID=UPI00038A39E7|nr:Nif3-like dinuclear metal center hexameric protein [Bacteriovorax sp. Seq25_V]EQC48046.1 dinuclear metal center protein, YbgI family [Bacteriovorax sp. Seq25_V]